MRGDEPGELDATSEPMRLTLELTPSREPIEGSLRLGSDPPLVFVGWVELVAALESILERAGPSNERASASPATKEA